MKNYILIDPTKINKEDQSLSEAGKVPKEEPIVRTSKKKAKANQNTSKDTEGQEADPPPAPSPPATDPPSEKPKKEPDGGDEPESTLVQKTKEELKALEKELSPGEEGDTARDLITDVGDFILNYGFGVGTYAFEEAGAALVNGDVSGAIEALQPGVDEAAKKSTEMYLAGKKGKEGWGSEPSEQEKEVADETAFYITQATMMVWALHVVRKKALEDIIETGRQMEWDNKKIKEAMEKFDKSNIFMKAMRAVQTGASIVPGIENVDESIDSALKKAGYDLEGNWKTVEPAEKFLQALKKNILPWFCGPSCEKN